jgi:hypothetical protein
LKTQIFFSAKMPNRRQSPVIPAASKDREHAFGQDCGAPNILVIASPRARTMKARPFQLRTTSGGKIDDLGNPSNLGSLRRNGNHQLFLGQGLGLFSEGEDGPPLGAFRPRPGLAEGRGLTVRRRQFATLVAAYCRARDMMDAVLARAISSPIPGRPVRSAILLRCLAALCLALGWSLACLAAEPMDIKIGYLRGVPSRIKLSLIDIPADNDGLAGAQLAIDDDNTTGRFINQRYSLIDKQIHEGDDVSAAVAVFADAGVSFFKAHHCADVRL